LPISCALGGLLSAIAAAVLLFFVGRLFGPKGAPISQRTPPKPVPQDSVKEEVERELAIEKEAREEKKAVVEEQQRDRDEYEKQLEREQEEVEVERNHLIERIRTQVRSLALQQIRLSLFLSLPPSLPPSLSLSRSCMRTITLRWRWTRSAA